MTLAEKYRPRTLSEVVGQSRTVATLERFAGKHGGRAYWITGPSGTGKTTIAKIIAEQCAVPDFVEEVFASDLTAAEVAKLEEKSHLSSWDQKRFGRVFIVNEAHGLPRHGIRALKDTLERIPRHCTWIFTTTLNESEGLFGDDKSEDAGPFVDRCIPLALQPVPAETVGEYCRAIAQAEGLDGRPLPEYVALAKAKKCSFRAVLQAIDAGCMMP
jgi:replication-associated recombination protein RarA